MEKERAIAETMPILHVFQITPAFPRPQSSTFF